MHPFEINEEEFNPKVMFGYRLKQIKANPPHQHDFISFHYIVSGHVKFMIDGQEFTAHKDDLVIVNPGVLHGHSESSDYEATEFLLGIDDLMIKGYPKNFIPICNAIIPIKKYQQDIYNCYHEIIQTQEKKDSNWTLMSRVLSLKFLVLLLKELSPQVGGSIQDYFQLKTYDKHTIVQTITTYFQENYMKKISVEEIARYSYLSTTYITKIYKEITGDTPINYLINLRMEKAIEILREGHFSIQDVAKKVGYDDPYYFSKLFKKKFGVSPLVYKRQALNQGQTTTR